MEILKSGFDFAPKNYNKPTPKQLKLVADILLLITMFIDFSMPWLTEMPEIENKAWILWIISGAAVLFKFITKLISDLNESTVKVDQG